MLNKVLFYYYYFLLDSLSQYFSRYNRSIKPKQINKIFKKNSNEYYEVSWFKMRCDYDKDLSDLIEYITEVEIQFFKQKLLKYS